MSVVGRTTALARIDAFVDDVAQSARTLVLEGEPGIGKTTLWQYAVDAANGAQYRVLATRAAEAESGFGYAGIAELLSGVEIELDGLPDPQRHALEVALLLAEPVHVPDPRAVFSAFTQVIRGLAAEGPVVVAVDDRQWLDASTGRALDFMARRATTDRVGVLVAQRTGFERPPQADLVRLGPLTPAALHTLVKERVGVSVPRTTILRVHETTNGNPFFALEVVRALLAAGLPRPADAWPVPDDLGDLVAARVDRLPSALRAKLVRAAAAAKPTVDGLTSRELLAGERAGIVVAGRRGGVAFAHPLFASAIYARTPPEDRRRVHRDLAAQARDLESRARHTALAADVPDEGTAALLDAAAARARERGAPDIAAELAERAATLTPDPAAAWVRRVASAEYRLQAGDLEQARDELGVLVRTGDAGPGRSRARRLLAEANHRLGSLQAALDQLRAAAEDASGDLAAATAVEVELAFVLNQSFTSFAESHAAAQRAIAAAEALGDGPILAQALAASLGTDFVTGRGIDEECVARALELEDADADVPVERRPTFVIAVCFAYADELERARTLLTGLRERLAAKGDETQLPLVLAYLALVECRAGHYVTAADLADDAAALADSVGDESDAALATAFRSLVAAHAGAEADARAAATAALRLAAQSGWRMAAFFAACALTHLELALGDAPGALVAVAESLGVAEAEDVVEPARWPYLPDALEALIAVGELERAERLTEMLGRQGRRLERDGAVVGATRARALLRAARGDTAGALAALREIEDTVARLDIPLEAARTLLVKGQLERRRKQKRAAQDSLQRALSICDSIGARLWAQRTRAELARIHGRAESELTATESRVAELAASGMTNREIAAGAFMSEKTVEANLSRVYRKLGIRSRAELGLMLAAASRSGTGLPEPDRETAG